MTYSYKALNKINYFFKMKWLFLVVLHFNWFYTVTYFTCLLWIFDRGKLSKSLLSKHDRHTPSRIAIKKNSIRVEGNLKFPDMASTPILLKTHQDTLWAWMPKCTQNANIIFFLALDGQLPSKKQSNALIFSTKIACHNAHILKKYNQQ